MGMNGMGGPNMAKMLQMMMPYMDPSTKRMMNIMVKLQELKSLMEPLHSDKPESGQSEGNGSAQPQRTQAAKPQKDDTLAQEGKMSGAMWDPMVRLRGMDERDKEVAKADFAAALQEGLTPEQQSMITSLSGMLR